MFKRKKKKAGCETPTYSRFSMAPEPTKSSKPNPNFVPPPSSNFGWQPKSSSTTPPSPPTSGSNAVKPKHIARGYIGTKEGFVHFAEQHDGLFKIENAEIYWIDESESIVVVASPEWRDYLTGRKDAPIVEKEDEDNER